jgi:hypothetical protein
VKFENEEAEAMMNRLDAEDKAGWWAGLIVWLRRDLPPYFYGAVAK